MTDNQQVGCVLMASGLSTRYGKNKLLEDLGGRAVILRTADNLINAALEPLAVTRSREVKMLLDTEGVRCIIHDGALKSDTIHVGLQNLNPDVHGILFMPADQPLVQPSSLQRLLERFEQFPNHPVRLGFHDKAGSPVLFPAAYRDALLAYTGDRGGTEVLKSMGVQCDVVQASHAWELWDVDTPEMMERVRRVFDTLRSVG